jgi:hypothetical protein
MNACDATTVVVATATAAQWQHLAATATVTPPGAHPEAMLKVVRQLLNNPLGLHASSSVAEQWRHDVDQLIVAVIHMLPHEWRRANHSGGVPVPSAAHSCTPTAPSVSSVACATTAPRAPAVSLSTMDLQAELERCRSGEDDHVTIERH